MAVFKLWRSLFYIFMADFRMIDRLNSFEQN